MPYQMPNLSFAIALFTFLFNLCTKYKARLTNAIVENANAYLQTEFTWLKSFYHEGSMRPNSNFIEIIRHGQK